MLLAVDVGNTNIMLGVYHQERLVTYWRVSTNRQSTEDEYGVLVKNLFHQRGIKDSNIKEMIISTVVPTLRYPLEEMGKKYFQVSPLVVGPGVKTGLNILMDNPKEVGADRIVNAVGALGLYGGPLIVVDFGTATTFCVISQDGSYLGGAIAPGINISTEALFKKAAKLPRVEFVRPHKVLGKDTISSMQSGIFYGFVGQVDGVVKNLMKEINQKPKVVATGGLARIISKESETINEVNLFLTLEGLRIINARNRRQEKTK